MKDIRQTKAYGNYLSKIGWIVERKDNTNYFIRNIPILGSVLKLQRPEKIDYQYIDVLVAKHRAFQIVIEPKNKKQELRIKNKGFTKSKSPYLPSRTLQLDLTKSKKELFNGLKKDARYALRKTQNSKLKTQNSNKIEEFRGAWKKSVPFSRYVPSLNDLTALESSFKNNCCLYQCINTSKQIIAGAIFLIGEKTAYYWQAFTNFEGRKNYTQYKILWEGILWTKESGAKVFDFEGIYDKRFPNKSWLGFTHFKKSFGGYEVEFPGAFIKTRIPLCFS